MAKIKRFGVLKTASFLGLWGVFVGLISAILISLILPVLANYLFSSMISPDAGLINVISLFPVNWSYLLYFPIIYGVIFFILGLIFTPIANLILKIIKGLDLDIEMYEEHKAYQPPPNYQPQNYQAQNYQQQNYQKQNY